MRKTSGITLIALVITIIVLIILSGVTITMILGKNGIISRAVDSKKQINEAEILQGLKIATLGGYNDEGKLDVNKVKENVINEVKGVTITGTEFSLRVITEYGEKFIITAEGEVTKIAKISDKKTPVGEEVTAISNSGVAFLEDDDGNEIKIPSGFGIPSDSGTKITEGIVIEDVSYENTKGSQYVWIPVFEYDLQNCKWGAKFSNVESKEENSDAYFNAIESALKTYVSGFGTSYYKDAWFGEGVSSLANNLYGFYDGNKFNYYTNGNMSQEEYTNLYRSMLKSVYVNKGFFIGRYEMGIAVANTVEEAKNLTRTRIKEYTPSKDRSTSTIIRANAAVKIGTEKPLSKANTVAYSYISQQQAQMLAESLGYAGTKESILFGIEWQIVSVFIQRCDNNNSAETKSQWLTQNSYSKLWGNYINSSFIMDRGFYSTTYNNSTVTWNNRSENSKDENVAWLCTTGASEQNRACNIYDFAGNLAEFTLEYCNNSDYPAGYRSGNYKKNNYATAGEYGANTYYGNSISSRVALILNWGVGL